MKDKTLSHCTYFHWGRNGQSMYRGMLEDRREGNTKAGGSVVDYDQERKNI